MSEVAIEGWLLCLVADRQGAYLVAIESELYDSCSWSRFATYRMSHLSHPHSSRTPWLSFCVRKYGRYTDGYRNDWQSKGLKIASVLFSDERNK